MKTKLNHEMTQAFAVSGRAVADHIVDVNKMVELGLRRKSLNNSEDLVN